MAAALMMVPHSRIAVQSIIFCHGFSPPHHRPCLPVYDLQPATGLVGWLIVLACPSRIRSRSRPVVYAVAAVDIWHWWGFLAVVYSPHAADQHRPIEAARLDGAGFLPLLRYVLLPGFGRRWC